ncbi:MAG: hypothetical protein ACREM8_12220 [Vulcanimicrobiaceae bacterium]
MLNTPQGRLTRPGAKRPCASRNPVPESLPVIQWGSMMTRSELHHLVDELPEEQVDAAAELLDAYRRGDRVLIQLLTAPLVPAEPDELAALAEGENDDPKETVSLAELKAELGLI